MMNTEAVCAWLEAQDQNNNIAIDDGGLRLVELDEMGKPTGQYLEIGGIPENEEAKRIQELLAKFPDLKPEMDENSLLRDLCCPQCGYRCDLHVTGTLDFLLAANGTVAAGDHLYNSNSSTVCHACGHPGVLSYFTFAGLDDALKARKSTAK